MLYVSCVASMVLFSALPGWQAKKPQKPAPKPPSKTAPTLGTVQMPGDNGKLNTTYQMGVKGTELHFTLKSAALEEIHPSPVDTLVAGPKERLLTLTFTVQNPLNQEQRLGSSEFHFTCVSPEDQNYEFRGSLLHPTKGTHLEQFLKPAQKVECTVSFPIYAEGPVTKVIVQRGSAPVLRYDLTDKVKKLDSVFSKDGVDLGDKATITLDQFQKGIVFGPMKMALVEGSGAVGMIQNTPPPDGERYWTMTVRFTNPMLKPMPIGFQYYTLELLTEDGEKLPWNSSMYNSTFENYLSMSVDPGDSAVAGYYFRVKKTKKPANLRITDTNSKRTIEVPAAW